MKFVCPMVSLSEAAANPKLLLRKSPSKPKVVRMKEAHSHLAYLMEKLTNSSWLILYSSICWDF